MPRRPHQRRVDSPPPCGLFKPAGIPARGLEEVLLTVDEYEALRLADYEGLYQEKVAAAMDVSRQTVGRILQTARQKVAEALVHGKALRIEGGAYVTGAERVFVCAGCGNRWPLPFGGGRLEACPACGGTDLRRLDAGRGQGGGRHGQRRGRGGPPGHPTG
jgi:uncharacterized protein